MASNDVDMRRLATRGGVERRRLATIKGVERRRLAWNTGVERRRLATNKGGIRRLVATNKGVEWRRLASKGGFGREAPRRGGTAGNARGQRCRTARGGERFKRNASRRFSHHGTWGVALGRGLGSQAFGTSPGPGKLLQGASSTPILSEKGWWAG
jgi:hypothetical protein